MIMKLRFLFFSSLFLNCLHAYDKTVISSWTDSYVQSWQNNKKPVSFYKVIVSSFNVITGVVIGASLGCGFLFLILSAVAETLDRQKLTENISQYLTRVYSVLQDASKIKINKADTVET